MLTFHQVQVIELRENRMEFGNQKVRFDDLIVYILLLKLLNRGTENMMMSGIKLFPTVVH